METFTDPRDGETYKIVQIGNLLWFAENLRYQGVPHYFPGRDSDNLHKYGCLYTWENAKLACPESWRLPTANEYLKLIESEAYYSWQNTTAIQSKSWNYYVSNSTGFNAIPAGRRMSNGYCYSPGNVSYFWSATPYGSCDAYRLYVGFDDANVDYNYINHAYSVRCVKEIRDE